MDDGIFKDMNCPISPEPYHWWKMDDPIGSMSLKNSGNSPTKTSGVIRTDYSSTNYGVIRSKNSADFVTMTTSTSGTNGDWIDFSSDNNFKLLPDGANGFTFSAKISILDLSYSGRIFTFYGNGNVIALGADKWSSNTSYVFKYNGGSWLNPTDPIFSDGTDYYDRSSTKEFNLTMTLESSNITNNLKLYKDGILKEQWNVPTISNWYFSNNMMRAAVGAAVQLVL